MNDIKSTLNTFEDSLGDLQLGLRNNALLQNFFPQEKISDILNTRLTTEGLNDDQLYDHRWLQRKFLISEFLLSLFRDFWVQNSTPELMKHQMCKIFFLHELYHLKQNIDSNGSMKDGAAF